MALGKWDAAHLLVLLHLSVLVSTQSPREKLIAFGEHIKIETMPHAVVILAAHVWPDSMDLFSGSILTERWVLTSAHTFTDFFVKNSEGGNVKIRSGIDHYSQEGYVGNVKRIICHEKYKDVPYDLCILQTFDQMSYSDRVRASSPPWPNETVNSFTHVRVAGWGMTESEHLPWELSAVDIPIMDNEECGKALGLELGSLEPGSFFCAGSHEWAAKTPCFGDSGSLAVVRRKNVSWVALGVTARGNDCAGTTLFMSVPYFKDWIKKYIEMYRGPASK